jgi:UDP-glucose 4-epimerase
MSNMAPQVHAKRAWVTGATSFLGRHVARQLSVGGFDVVGFSRRPVALELAKSWGFSAIEVGDFDFNLLERACRQFASPTVVFHAVGSGSVGHAEADPTADFERTFQTTELLIGALGKLAPGARLLYPSSAAVYGIVPEGPISENTAVRPFSEYGKTKLLTEEMCREKTRSAGVHLTIARFFSVYGPPQRKLLLWDLAQRILSGETTIKLGGTGRETRDFIYVADAAAMVATLAQSTEAQGTFNIGTGRATSTMEVATKLASAMDSNAEIVFSGVPRPGDPAHQQADIAQLSRIARPVFVSLEQGLADYARWLSVGASDPSEEPALFGPSSKDGIVEKRIV